MTLKVFFLKFTAFLLRLFPLMDSYMVELMKTQKELNCHIWHAFLPNNRFFTNYLGRVVINSHFINCIDQLYT